jgi:uncharacterized protein YciI
MEMKIKRVHTEKEKIMFIVSLNYIKSIDEVEKQLNPHIQYLDKYYGLQKFICSGRKNPRTGGLILCNAEDREEVDKIISEDPFYVNEIAEYEIIEFSPTKYAEGFEKFMK